MAVLLTTVRYVLENVSIVRNVFALAEVLSGSLVVDVGEIEVLAGFVRLER